MKDIDKFIRKYWQYIIAGIMVFIIFMFGCVKALIALKNFIVADYIRAFIILMGGLTVIFAVVGFSNGTYTFGEIFSSYKKENTPKNMANTEEVASTYRLLRKAIFTIINSDVGRAANIAQIANVNDLNASPKTTVMNGYILYHYNLVANGKVDTKTIKSLIQNRLIRYLENDQIAGISHKQAIFYNGVWIPAILVDSVVDQVNGIIKLNLTIPTQEYLKQKEYKLQTNTEAKEAVEIDEDDFS